MAKPLAEPKSTRVTRSDVNPGEVRPGDVKPLSPSVRRHLGKSLRSFYADALSEPVSERLAALLVRLDKPPG